MATTVGRRSEADIRLATTYPWNDSSFPVDHQASPTKGQAGGQIDLMIQSKFHTLCVWEIRFSAKPIGTGIIGGRHLHQRG